MLVRTAVLFLAGWVSLAGLAVQTGDHANWPQFRGNQALTGVVDAALPSSLKVHWTYDFGEAVESSAAISDGVVYAASHSGELVALDLFTGEPLWKYEASGPIGESSAAVAGNVVYIGDLSGVVHAVAADTGRGLWTYQTENEIKASPVVVGDRVLIGSYDGHLHALSATDGELLWKVQTEGPVHATAGVSEGVTYITGCDALLRAIRISDGRELFSIESGAYTGASPALAGEMAFYGTFDNEVLGVNLKTRSVAWRYSHPQRNFPFYSSAAVAEGKVVIGGRDRIVHCLEAASGKAVWTFTTRARVDSSPVVAKDRVYVGSNDGRLYVLDLASGEKRWEFNAGAAITASPAVGEERLVVGSHDGQLYCLGPR